MISYVFGAKFDATDIIVWAKEKGLFVIEDQAESFYDVKLSGHPEVDFATYSFGTIKTNSSFGGSISIVRNHEALYRKMMAI
jgi:dTDP-4-amino-4,6-dideoxygalactose transaminase